MARTLIRLVEQVASGARAERVARARLRIGELTAVDSGVLRGAFEEASRGTVAEGCVLEVDRIAVRLECRRCGTERGGPVGSPCPVCGEARAEILEGREAWIDSIEVDAARP